MKGAITTYDELEARLARVFDSIRHHAATGGAGPLLRSRTRVLGPLQMLLAAASLMVVVLGGDINNNREAAAELRELIEVQGGRVQKAVSIRTLLFADLVSAG